MCACAILIEIVAMHTMSTYDINLYISRPLSYRVSLDFDPKSVKFFALGIARKKSENEEEERAGE